LPNSFKLVCTSLSSDEVLDNIIPRKFNPKLIELVNKYALTPPKSDRVIRVGTTRRMLEYYSYIEMKSPLEVRVVDAIHSYRDLFLKLAIDLNFFRHGLANLATSIMHKNPDYTPPAFDNNTF